MTPFASRFEQKVLRTIRKFKLIRRGDKLLVAVSGGKDSTAVLYILNRYFRNVEAVTINASIGNYSRKSLDSIKMFCSQHRIPLHVISFREEFGRSLCYMRSALRARGLRMTSCAICGILKRYLLNKKALELKADKLATGHNLDDEAQSFMMSLLRSNMGAAANPAPGIAACRKLVPRIKPLFLSFENEVEKYSRIMGFPVVYGRCPCSVDAFRRLVRNLLGTLEKGNPGIKLNIVSYFLKKPRIARKEPKACCHCHQPSGLGLCRACQILAALNKKSPEQAPGIF